jgi:uncharacterized protein YwqG
MQLRILCSVMLLAIIAVNYVSKQRQKRRRNTNSNANANKSAAIESNGRITELGKKFDWRGILDIYQTDRDKFSHFNYATTTSQLGRIRSLRKEDPRFEDLMFDIAAQLQNSATRSPWGARGLANIYTQLVKCNGNPTASWL